MSLVSAEEALKLEVQNLGFEEYEVRLIDGAELGRAFDEDAKMMDRVRVIVYEVKNGDFGNNQLRYAVYKKGTTHSDVSMILRTWKEKA